MGQSDFEESVKKVLAGERVRTTPRKIVGWFGYARRGRNVVSYVRRKLRQKLVTTDPDFDSVWIDDPVYIVKAEPSPAKGKDAKATTGAKKPAGGDGIDPSSGASGPASLQPVEPSHRISRLEAAGRVPVSVNPSDTRDKAVTLMLQHDYSQLPVMQNKSVVKGMVSWRSIGRKLHMGHPCKTVEQCMESAYEVPDTASLFEVVKLIARVDAVLVRTSNNLISGIVTQADINKQFSNLGEPFLLIGDIENALRALIDYAFDLKALKAAVHSKDDPDREVKSVHDLTFGEIIRLIQKPDQWEKLELPLDRAEVVKRLEKVRDIRNDVMHFDPDPLEDQALQLLRESSNFFAELMRLKQ